MQLKLNLKSTKIRIGVMALLAVAAFAVFLLMPDIAIADVEGSLKAVRSKLTGVILPVLAVIAIAWAAFSLMTGNERAKTHIWYAIIGSAIAFGAQSLVDFISQNVR